MKVIQYSVAIAAMSLLFGGCSKQNEGEVYDPEMAAADYHQMSESAESDVVSMVEAQGVAAIIDLSDLVTDDNIFMREGLSSASNELAWKKKINDFKAIFSPASNLKVSGEAAFDFASKAGYYEWDEGRQAFIETGASTNIEIEFPVENSSVNNGIFTIEAYEEVNTKNGYQITSLKANLKVNNLEKMRIDLSGTYDDSGTPTSLNVNLSIDPFLYVWSVSDAGNNTLLVSSSVTKNDETFLKSDMNLLFYSSNKDSVQRVDGYVEFYDYKILGHYDIEGVRNSLDLNEDPNEHISLNLYNGANRFGSIVYIKKVDFGEEGYYAHVQYTNGNQEALEDSLNPILDKLETTLQDLGLSDNNTR